MKKANITYYYMYYYIIVSEYLPRFIIVNSNLYIYNIDIYIQNKLCILI